MKTEVIPETIELTVPARAEFVRIVRLVMAGIANSLAFNVDEIDDLKTAVSEAYNMCHPSEDNPLNVRTSVDLNRLVVEVSQRYEERATSRLFAMDNSIPLGMGMILLRQLMDEVEYKTDSSEMQVRFIKYRPKVP